MRLKNTTEWSDQFLRRMVSWCRKELRLPASHVREARFGNRRRGWSGRANYGGLRILVRLGETKYPTRSRYTKQVGAVVFEMHDKEEVLVNITAHELAHLKHDQSGAQFGGSEQSIDRQSFVVLEAFRANREVLLSEWSQAVERQKKPRASVQERRAIKAASDLARWQRKLKLAQTKIRKLKTRVRYYDRRQAAVSQ